MHHQSVQHLQLQKDYKQKQQQIAAIGIIHDQLISLGIVSVGNGLFFFIEIIIISSTLLAQIAICMKLIEEQQITGNITASSDDYSIMGVKPP